jgi:hypothetical protein
VEVNARSLQITLDALKMLRAFMVFPHDDLSDFKISTKLKIFMILFYLNKLFGFEK